MRSTKRSKFRSKNYFWTLPNFVLNVLVAAISIGLLPSVLVAQTSHTNAFAPSLPYPTPASNTPSSDPTIVRPQGYRLQSQSSVGPFASQHQTSPITLPSGQRVFPASSGRPDDRASNEAMVHPIQQASWSTVVPSTVTSSTASPAILSDNATSSTKSKLPLELKPPSKDVGSAIPKPTSSWSSALSMIFSLVIVLCLFLMVAWMFRKSQPNQSFRLPSGVVQVLGRSPMAPRQQVYVVRFGNKMLLVSHQPGQTQTLAEITDADEIQRLAGMCEASQPNSISQSFRDVLSQVSLGKPDRKSPSKLRGV